MNAAATADDNAAASAEGRAAATAAQASALEAVRFRVTGRVQGVYFRASAR